MMAEEDEEEEEKRRCAVANLIPSSWLETTANKARSVKISTPSLPEKEDDDDDDDDDALFFSLRSYASHSEIRNNERTRDWMYALTETNMRKMYEQTWGWNSLEKRRELNHQNAKFVFAVEKKKKKKCDDGSTKSEEEDQDEELPVAFAHFRFEVDDDDVASVYIYELQVERTKKRLGLGRLLMRACEKIAVELGLKHMALTVLKKNEGARAFYEKIGYEETDHAPADAHYVILRKRV
jgi:ribosomal protein S18 acetylase RimI-like enzyme